MDHIIRTGADLEQVDRAQIVEVALDALVFDGEQPRHWTGDDALAPLAASIRAHGVLQPITVRVDEAGNIVVVHGERRARAARLAGEATVPAQRLRDANVAAEPVERLWEQLAENLQREGLSAIELAEAFQALRAAKLKVKDIAEQCERRGFPALSRSAVSNHLRLLELPDGWRQAVHGGELGEAHGRELLVALGGGPAVVRRVDEQLDELRKRELPITTLTIRDAVARAFTDTHPRIDGVGCKHPLLGDTWARPAFDPEECSKCKCRRIITAGHGGRSVFCVDPEAFREKQTAALQAQAEAEVEHEKDRALDPDDDWADPDADEHRLAGPRDDIDRAAVEEITQPDRAELRVREDLVEWLRTWCVVGEQPLEHRVLQERVLAWWAAGAGTFAAPGLGDGSGAGRMAPCFRSFLAAYSVPEELCELGSALDYESGRTAVLRHALGLCRPLDVVRVAEALGFDPSTAGWRVTEDFAARRLKAELVALLHDAGVSGDGVALSALPVMELRARLVAEAERVGVPACIERAWEGLRAEARALREQIPGAVASDGADEGLEEDAA